MHLVIITNEGGSAEQRCNDVIRFAHMPKTNST